MKKWHGLRTDEKTEHQIVKDYQAGVSSPMIGEKHGIDNSTVSLILRRNGIKTRTRKDYKNISINRSFFKTIDTPTKAQILGLLAADGCLSMRKDGCRSVVVSLQERDHDYLRTVADLLEFKAPLRKSFARAFSIEKEKTVQYRLVICGEEMFRDLERAGLHQRKSLTLKVPTLDQVPEHLAKFFLLGYLEGDGWIAPCKNTEGGQVGIISTREFCLSVQKILSAKGWHSTIDTSPRYHGKNVYHLNVTRIKDIFQFLEWLYQDAPFRMERKHQKFVEWRSRYDENYQFIKTPEWQKTTHENKSRGQLNRSPESKQRQREGVRDSFRKRGMFFVKSPTGQVFCSNLKSNFLPDVGLKMSGAFYDMLKGKRNSHLDWSRPTDAEIAVAKENGTLITKLY